MSTGRRWRFGSLSAVLILAATASLVVANMLATKFSVRMDATSTREHRLSPRSSDLLGRLRGEYEVVIAAPLRDSRTIDPTASDRVREVLEQFRRGSSAEGKVSATLIDTGSPAGVAEFESLLARLAERDRAPIERQIQSLSESLRRSVELADWLDALSPRLLAVREAIPIEAPGAATNRSYFEQRAAEARVNARALRELAGKSDLVLEEPTGQLPIPDLDKAAGPLRQPLIDVHTGIGDIAENLRRFGESSATPPAAADLAKPLAIHAVQGRDLAATIRDRVERLERIDLLRVAKSLQAASGALVIGPPERGLTAVNLDELLPPPAALTAQAGLRADVGRNAEELIATAIASLNQPIKPIVVFMHGQPVQPQARFGLLQSPDFVGLLDRLALRGIDAVEWAVCGEPEPPSLLRLDPAGNRPVVYVALSTDASSNVAGRGQSGPERAATLGRAVAGIVRSGKAVLLSLNPSTLPTLGEPDPMVAALPAFGLSAETGKPLLSERFGGDGRRVDYTQVIVTEESEHPIARAVRGLPVRFEWPVAIRPAAAQERGASETPTAGAASVPLFRAEGRAIWGESQWLGLWQARGQPTAPGSTLPTQDEGRDDTTGTWMIAAAATRPFGDKGSQRLVVVGANTWFMDRIAMERVLVDGRPVFTSPGNAELFEASVSWLAGQDEMIAPSPTARAVPIIRPLSDGIQLALRWLAIAGLPGTVLLAGMVWRLLRA